MRRKHSVVSPHGAGSVRLDGPGGSGWLPVIDDDHALANEGGLGVSRRHKDRNLEET
jgi:hypothetical protein